MSATIERKAENERQAEVDDCATEIARLSIHAALLADEAKTDKLIAAEVKDLESQQAAAKGRLYELIGEERERRIGAEAEAAAAEERRAEHAATARKLGLERQNVDRAIDAAFAAFAQLLAKHHEIARRQADELVNAGNRQAADVARPKARIVNSALRFALIRANVPSAAIELPPGQGPGGRMVELDPVPIEPEG